MKKTKITVSNYSALSLEYRALIAPYYLIDNKDGQWIAKVKTLLQTALTSLAFDTIEETNVSKSTVTFTFKDKGVTKYTVNCEV